MPRPRRLHIPGGVYYAVQECAAGRRLFTRPSDYAHFEELLARAASKAHARVLAFCWLPSSAHLVVQVDAVPLGRLLQGFTSRYARYVHARTQESGHVFADRYRAMLVEPAPWLPALIRYVHYTPVLEGLTRDIGDYPHTSHRFYAQREQRGWVDARSHHVVLDHVAEADGYTTLMLSPPRPDELEQFAYGLERGVLARQEFIAALPHGARDQRTSLTLDRLIREVAILVEIEPADLYTHVRRRDLALARAVIAWHARERGVANLREVALRLRRDASTLSAGIARYRQERPELFALGALRHLRPLG